MRIDDATGIDVAIEGILLWCARIVCDFDTTRVPSGVVVDVEVGCFVEAVKERPDCWLRKVVVDVCEAVALFRPRSSKLKPRLTL